MIGVQINVPLPVPNLRKGEIAESQAEQAQAALQLHQAEVNVMQDVASAVSRFERAQQHLDLFRNQTLPDLQRAFDDMETLFKSGEPGLDLGRVFDVRRKWLKAQDNFLDALLSVRLARVDILAATGEPALDLCTPAAPSGEPLPVPNRR
jgi:outer membrane protein TolC